MHGLHPLRSYHGTHSRGPRMHGVLGRIATVTDGDFKSDLSTQTYEILASNPQWVLIGL